VAREVQLICEYRSRFLILEETSLWAETGLSLQVHAGRAAMLEVDIQMPSRLDISLQRRKVGCDLIVISFCVVVNV
jgi:hypothetical protein